MLPLPETREIEKEWRWSLAAKSHAPATEWLSSLMLGFCWSFIWNRAELTRYEFTWPPWGAHCWVIRCTGSGIRPSSGSSCTLII